MKKNKLLGCLAVAAMIGGLASCGGSTTEVAILVPSADHGWTGAVLQNAQDHAAELNKAGGAHTYKVYACNDAEHQMNTIDDLLAKGSAVAGVVILPYDNTVESAITKLANGTVPFTMFDRIIENAAVSSSKSHVSNVKGDNEGIGRATAERFFKLGLAKGDKILVMPGDNSSVPESRNKGFQDVLKEEGWTEADIEASLVSTDYTGWSRAKGTELFTNWINATSDIASYKWVFTHDSEISLGIMEALAGSTITDAKKTEFKNAITSIASSSGLEEMYQVIRGDHPRSSQYDAWVGEMSLFDVTYDPGMIKTAINDINDHLEGKKVEKNHVVPVEVIDESNVANKTGFGGKVTA